MREGRGEKAEEPCRLNSRQKLLIIIIEQGKQPAEKTSMGILYTVYHDIFGHIIFWRI